MNTRNNRRRRESVKRMEEVFSSLILKEDLSSIQVTTICRMAGVNRSTFYNNFRDVYDLAGKIMDRINEEFFLELAQKENMGMNRETYTFVFSFITTNELFMC